MSVQQPTVLVRIYGKTRDQIDAMRLNRYGDFGPKESFAATIGRLIEQYGVSVPEKKKPAGAKRSRRPRAHKKTLRR